MFQTLRVEFGMYIVSNSLQPSKGLLFSYRSLPVNIEDDIYAYEKFVSSYGLYIRSSVVFGGILEVREKKSMKAFP